MTSRLKDKLLRVERTINIYTKDGGEPLQEIPVDNIPFEKLKDAVRRIMPGWNFS
jgi:hypothetical protein